MKTTNSTLRLPIPLADALDQVAEEAGLPRHTLILQLLDDALATDADGPRLSPTLVIGYIPLTGGELDAADCPECGQPIAQPYVGFIVGARRPLPIGPVCALCATTQ
jgi:hypothetical protein